MISATSFERQKSVQTPQAIRASHIRPYLRSGKNAAYFGVQ